MTKKLFSLKQWLTVPDAVRHLSTAFEEETSEADVLRLALDGHLKLSVYFVNHARVRVGKVVSFEDALVTYFPTKMVKKDHPDWLPVRHVRGSDPVPADILEDLKHGKVHAYVGGLVLDDPPAGSVARMLRDA